jgi:NAD(P)H-dependent FMN reductase
MRILAISGSLRAASSNSTLLSAVTLLAPASVEVMIYAGLANLPHFNPDLDRELDAPTLPAQVRELRSRVAAADALLISSPEYAHGVPGSLKNALDWLVGGSEMPGMPVALLSASARATYAQASLAETLRTMSATIVPGSPFVAPVTGRGLDAAGAADDPEVRAAVAAAIAALARAAADRRDSAHD